MAIQTHHHLLLYAYTVQAIVVNFLPLLFITLRAQYGISLADLTFLVTFNFTTQLLTDLLAPPIVARVGTRGSLIAAHVLAVAGFVALVTLPEWLGAPFWGLLIAVVLYAVGGGLLEVLVSPVVEACPSDNKEGAMSLLHSFYCWGQVAVVLLSTLFFLAFGTQNWKIMALLWTVVPLLNIPVLARVPIAPLIKEGESALSLRELLCSRLFWLMILLMACAGASEQAVNQWASAFAEQGLGISKTWGDIAGPMLFAVMMGIGRVIYGKYSDRMDLRKVLIGSGVLCVICYLLVAFSPWPVGSLVGCALCGVAVSLMWPGTLSMAAGAMPRGGTAMFAYLALAGDLGCALGPTVTGQVSSALGDNLHMGLFAAVVFPVLIILGVARKPKQT